MNKNKLTFEYANIFFLFTGIIYCDLKTPAELVETYREFPPFYTSVKDFTLADMQGPMKTYAETYDLQPGKSFLTNKHNVTGAIIPSEMARYYLQQGLIVENIVKVIQFRPGDYCFYDYVQELIEERRRGAKIQGDVFGNMAKLVLNAAVGYSIMRLDKFPTYKIVDDKGYKKLFRKNLDWISYEFLGATANLRDYFGEAESENFPDLHMIGISPFNDTAIKTSSLPMLIGKIKKIIIFNKKKVLIICF